jgi:Arc/MetJ-type ribon-helix-helix transcriptional regulator
MDAVARRKVHFAPYRRQKEAIDKLVRSGRFRDVTHFMRLAVDHYLDHMGRPPLSVQARQMAEEWRARRGDRRSERLQAPSMSTYDEW